MPDTTTTPPGLEPDQKKEYQQDEADARRQEREVQSRPDGGGIRTVPSDAREDVEEQRQK